MILGLKGLIMPQDVMEQRKFLKGRHRCESLVLVCVLVGTPQTPVTPSPVHPNLPLRKFTMPHPQAPGEQPIWRRARVAYIFKTKDRKIPVSLMWKPSQVL